jgi:hypothetical protein
MQKMMNPLQKTLLQLIYQEKLSKEKRAIVSVGQQFPPEMRSFLTMQNRKNSVHASNLAFN